MSEQEKMRVVEKIVEIDAPIEEVWSALTDADEIKKWFSTDAGVEAGEGGKLFVAWGEDFSGNSLIEIWDPPTHLRTTEIKETRQETQYEGSAPSPMTNPLSVDYYLESKGGNTVLRLVHSGFGDGAEWDDEYDAILRGWGLFLINLQHFLERHRNDASQHAWIQFPFPVSREEAWQRLIGPEGLAADGKIEGLQHGDRFSVKTAWEENIEGVMHVNAAPADLAFSMEHLNDSLFRISFFKAGLGGLAGITLLTYGQTKEAFKKYCAEWGKRLRSLFDADKT